MTSSPAAVCDQMENDVRQLALDRTSGKKRENRREKIDADGDPEVVKVCPSAQELRWESPDPATSSATTTTSTSCVCPVKACNQLVLKTVGGLLKHINDFHPYLSSTRNFGKVCS